GGGDALDVDQIGYPLDGLDTFRLVQAELRAVFIQDLGAEGPIDVRPVEPRRDAVDGELVVIAVAVEVPCELAAHRHEVVVRPPVEGVFHAGAIEHVDVIEDRGARGLAGYRVTELALPGELLDRRREEIVKFVAVLLDERPQVEQEILPHQLRKERVVDVKDIRRNTCRLLHQNLFSKHGGAGVVNLYFDIRVGCFKVVEDFPVNFHRRDVFTQGQGQRDLVLRCAGGANEQDGG